MNVKVKHFTEPIDRKALLAEKDFKEGDVIYTVGFVDPCLSFGSRVIRNSQWCQY